MTSRSDSESSASPRFVEPLRSEKTIVTVLRTSCGATAGASGVPQKPQSRNRSGFSSPQDGQVTMRRVYAAQRAVLRGATLTEGRVRGDFWAPEVPVGRPAPAGGGHELQPIGERDGWPGHDPGTPARHRRIRGLSLSVPYRLD